jgi:hypothetical protein
MEEPWGVARESCIGSVLGGVRERGRGLFQPSAMRQSRMGHLAASGKGREGEDRDAGRR